MLRVRLRSSAWGVGVSLLLVGCDPKIIDFDVQPRRVCAGDTVHTHWKVRGTPHLLADRLTVDSVDLIRYTIVAESHSKKASRAIDVITFTPGAPKILVAETVMQGTDSLVGRDSASAAVWHSLVQVGEVRSDSGRALRVRHGGREGVVGPGREASAVWRGLSVSGVWELRSGLKAREVPGNRARHPPRQLFLRVSLACAAQGGQP
jgi:hypothetical protein